LKQGNPAEFTAMYNLYSKNVYNFILIKVKNEHAAEDILSETFISAIKSHSKIFNDKNILSWLLTIAVRRIADYFRKNIKESKKIEMAGNQNCYSIMDQAEEINLKEQALFLKMAIDNLPDEYKKAILLRHYDKKCQKEIAGILNKSESAIETILVRGKKMLKKELINLKGFYYEK